VNESEVTGEHKSKTESGKLTLSPKPFDDFRADEFKAYVVSLFEKPPEPKRLRPPAALTLKQGKKPGHLIIKTNRKPVWIMEPEVLLFANELKLPVCELRKVLEARGVTTVSDAKSGLSLQKDHRAAKKGTPNA
jgi:hypothetical protein